MPPRLSAPERPKRPREPLSVIGPNTALHALDLLDRRRHHRRRRSLLFGARPVSWSASSTRGRPAPICLCRWRHSPGFSLSYHPGCEAFVASSCSASPSAPGEGISHATKNMCESVTYDDHSKPHFGWYAPQPPARASGCRGAHSPTRSCSLSCCASLSAAPRMAWFPNFKVSPLTFLLLPGPPDRRTPWPVFRLGYRLQTSTGPDQRTQHENNDRSPRRVPAGRPRGRPADN